MSSKRGCLSLLPATAVRLAAALLMTVACAGTAAAAELRLGIQPVLPPAELQAAYQPLADYLGAATGTKVVIEPAGNFLAYWEGMRRGRYDLVLDAAHFTDFRVKRLGYHVLAKLPDTVSYALVTGEDMLLFDAQEMIGKTLATVPSPSLGGVRLSQLFPNPLRQPILVATSNFQDALTKVQQGKAVGALVPTRLVTGRLDLNTVLTTRPVPHMAISAAAGVDAASQDAIRKALLAARESPAGRRMLTAVRLEGFEPATAATYDGYEKLLEGVWGY